MQPILTQVISKSASFFECRAEVEFFAQACFIINYLLLNQITFHCDKRLTEVLNYDQRDRGLMAHWQVICFRI